MQVERLFEAEPRLLTADMRSIVADLQRLVPGADPAKLIVTHAGMVLDMGNAGMQASLTIDDGISAP